MLKFKKPSYIKVAAEDMKIEKEKTLSTSGGAFLAGQVEKRFFS